jgi:transposase-like protein
MKRTTSRKKVGASRPTATRPRSADSQRVLPLGDPAASTLSEATSCSIVSVGKRRDGGTRYWCLRHRADATAKYGRRAQACRAAHIPPIGAADTFVLNLDEYKGGVALWGAVPPVYDTTRLPLDRGIHVHARATARASKEIDFTYRAVVLKGAALPQDGLSVSELDAIYYMVSSVFGYEMKQVLCTFCGYPHLDRDWFSVHPHIRHLCAGCGRHFRDTDVAIGNPICGVREAAGIKKQNSRPSPRKLNIRQTDFPGGIQVWGSNLAFVWTNSRDEEEGIHVHAFKADGSEPAIDETFSEVTIDGIALDPAMVRTLMAQNALPHIGSRVMPVPCPSCHTQQFATETGAFTPVAEYRCSGCRRRFAPRTRLRRTIANPLPSVLNELARFAPRPPQQNALDLLPETL